MKLIKEIKLIFIYIQFLNENYEIVDIIGAKANENNKIFLIEENNGNHIELLIPIKKPGLSKEDKNKIEKLLEEFIKMFDKKVILKYIVI